MNNFEKTLAEFDIKVTHVLSTMDLAEFCPPGPLMTGGWEPELDTDNAYLPSPLELALIPGAFAEYQKHQAALSADGEI